MQATPEHTFGPSCHFARNVDSQPTGLKTIKGEEDMPPLKAQFFHASPLPIDDPLSALPNIGGTDAKSSIHTPLPFSDYDNNALEEAWQNLSVERKTKVNKKMDRLEAKAQAQAERAARKIARRAMTSDGTMTPELLEKRHKALRDIGTKHATRHAMEQAYKELNVTPPGGTPGTRTLQSLPPVAIVSPSQTLSTSRSSEYGASASHSGSTPCCADLEKDVRTEHRAMFRNHFKKRRDRKADQAKFMEDAIQVVRKKRLAYAGSPPQVDGTRSGLSSPKPHIPRPKSAEPPHSHAPEAKEFPKFTRFVDTRDAARDSCSESDSESENESGSEADSDFSDVSAIPQGDGTKERHRPRTKYSHGFVDMSYFQADATDDKTSTVPESALLASGSGIDIEKALEEDRGRKATEKHQRSKDHARYEKHLQSEEHRNGDEDDRHTQSREHRKYTEHAQVHHRESDEPEQSMSSNLGTAMLNPAALHVQETTYGSSPSTADTTGNPFLRASPFPKSKSPVQEQDDSDSCHDDDCLKGGYPGHQHRGQSATRGKETTVHDKGCKATKAPKHYSEVVVGISRLHLVTLPALQMMPIYWSKLHDVSAVIRGTWFHQDTMLPVDPTVANQLESGYRELRPWSQTWRDEIKSALEVGAAGEEKISHRLWPKETQVDGKSRSFSAHEISTDPYCAAKCFNGQAAASGSVDPSRPGEPTPINKTVTKRYPNSHVIYKDDRNAFILKTSLQPSAYYSRRPLAKIMKNTPVGMHVVRGFDWATWDKLHPKKKSVLQKKAKESGNIPQSGTANIAQHTCPACKKYEERQKVTDLVLVAHGIGQKLSERIESFHFTHAVNAFRRSVNIEFANDAVQHVFREDLGGVMVLPVNWRENLSFEDGGPMKGEDTKADPDSFTLKDVTPDTIPAVRGFISDVCLDIPFYMSQHKPTMIKALVTEANRIYRLWCKNNPEFHREGRVHLIAHSLGSVMAVEALSRQPTFVSPGKLDLRPHKIQSRHFDFDTKNLFLVGSPLALFLLIEKAGLIPRQGRTKPGAEPEDGGVKGIASERVTLGCLAIDNIYNVMHPNDPIAYRLNAAVSSTYAQSLKKAEVPSSATSIFAYMSGLIPGKKAAAEVPVGELAPVKPNLARLPSTLEMEEHDFSSEEIAEKRFYRLNDNGQIDYFLNPGSGTIEYLNMLGAHSSYWGNADFVRMVVTEIGRRPGRDCSLPNMRAVKISPTARKQEKSGAT